MSHFNLKSLLSLSFRNFFNKYAGHWLPSSTHQRFHIRGNFRSRIPRAPFLYGCYYSAPQYGGRDGDFYYRLSACRQLRQWAEEQNTQRHWKWSTNVCSSYCSCEFSMHPSSKHEGQYQKSFWWKHSPTKKYKKFDRKSINEEARQQINVPWHLKPRSSLDLIATASCPILVVVVVDRQIHQLINVEARLTSQVRGWIYLFWGKGTNIIYVAVVSLALCIS